MSDWRGDNNPGHQRRLALWRAIEEEFGEPLKSVIQGLREQDKGNSWRTVAGCLGVSRCTLLEWRRALDLPLNKHGNVYDPSSVPEYTATDEKAQELGYEDAVDAVLDLRLKQRLTLSESAKALGVHPSTVAAYTPPAIRGAIYNRSEGWWIQRRQWARDMLQRRKMKYRHGGHPFNYDNDILFHKR